MIHRKLHTKEIALEIRKYDNAPLEVRHHFPRNLKFRPAARRELLFFEYIEVLSELQIFLDNAEKHIPAAVRGMQNSNLEYSITAYCRPPLPHEIQEDHKEHRNTYSLAFAFGRSIRNTYLSRAEGYQIAMHDIEQEIAYISPTLKTSPFMQS